MYPWLCSPDFASRNNFCGYLFNVTYSCSITKNTKLFLWWAVRSWCLYVIFKLCIVFWRGKKSIKLGIFALTSPSGIILLLRMLSLQLDSPPWKGNDTSWVQDSIALPIYPPTYRMDWDHSRFRTLVLALFVGGFNFMLSSVSFFSVAETSQVKFWVPGWANSNSLLKNMDWDCTERPWAWKIMHYCGLCLLKVTWRTEEGRTWNEGDVQRGATVEAKRGSFLVTAMPFSSVQSLSPVWLCNPMACSTPCFPIHYQPPELAQTHVHRVGDAIQPSHPLASPSPTAFNLSQNQGLFQWVSSLHQVAKVLEFQNQSFQWIFRTDFF